MKAMRDHSRAQGTTRAVGVAVASYMNRETGLSFPGNKDLQAWGWSESTIRPALRELEKLGELVRVPEMEDVQRPRIYHLPLATQISMLDGTEEGGPATGVAPANIAPVIGAAPAALTRVREGTLEPTSLTSYPPTPQGEIPGTSPSGLVTGPEPRAALAERAAGARRRQRRRGRGNPSSVVASVPCPLLGLTADRVAWLIDEWEELKEPISARLGESVYEIWIAPGHLHETEARFVVGYPVATVGWAQERYGPLLSKLAGKPVVFVPCSGVSAGAVEAGRDVAGEGAGC